MTKTQLKEVGESQDVSIVNAVQDMVFNDALYKQVEKVATLMASSKTTIPQHLKGNVGDCMAVVMQALAWNMSPWPVAQKTHLVSGTLGYEAQLVNGVINAMSPTKDRINYEWFGDWSRVLAKLAKKQACTPQDEDGVGIKCWATIKGEDEPRVLELFLSQASVRNSPLWKTDPRQQLAYLVVKRWARLHVPDVILGIYTPDELDESKPAPRDVTPKKAESRASSIKDKLKKKTPEPVVEEAIDAEFTEPEAEDTIEDVIEALNAAANEDELSSAAGRFAVGAMPEEDQLAARQAYQAKLNSWKSQD